MLFIFCGNKIPTSSSIRSSAFSSKKGIEAPGGPPGMGRYQSMVMKNGAGVDSFGAFEAAILITQNHLTSLFLIISAQFHQCKIRQAAININKENRARSNANRFTPRWPGYLVFMDFKTLPA
jgi:hypothetical protein